MCLNYINTQGEIITKGKVGDNATAIYNTETKELTIEGSGECWDFEYYQEGNPFNNVRGEIVRLVVKQGITLLNYNMFAMAWELKEVILPRSLTVLREGVFQNCKKLEEIVLPEKIEFLDVFVFGQTDKLRTIKIMNTIPPRLTLVDNPPNYNTWRNTDTKNITLYVPQGSKWLYEATKGWNVFKEIKEFIYSGMCGDESYWELYNDTLRIWGAGRTDEMGNDGWRQPWLGLRNDIKTIVVEEGIEEINYNGLAFLDKLEEIVLPKSLKILWWGSMQMNTKIEKITIPENVIFNGSSLY